MVTIIFDNKKLKVSSDAPIYQHENNVDWIRCIIPKEYSGFNLTKENVLVTLCYRTGAVSRELDLSLSDTEYDETRAVFTAKINSSITSASGKVSLWLKIFTDDGSLSLETDEGSISVLPSKGDGSTSEAEFEATPSQFVQWKIKMEQTRNAANTAVREATEQANTARKLVADFEVRIKQLLQDLEGGGELGGYADNQSNN